MAARRKIKAAQVAARAEGDKVRETVGAAPDGFALLETDHREVADLFDRFDGAEAAAKKKPIAAQICLSLKVHAQIEEELLYPTAREKTGDGDLVDEAIIESAIITALRVATTLFFGVPLPAARQAGPPSPSAMKGDFH